MFGGASGPSAAKRGTATPLHGHDAHHAAVRARVFGNGDDDARWRALHDDGDELAREMGARRVFAGWTTEPPPFAPTFKVRRGTACAAAAAADAYYDAKRIPSWCDRVLWRSLPGHASRLTLVEYCACETVGSSDHKPVRATFAVRLSPPPPPPPPPACLARLRWPTARSRRALAAAEAREGGAIGAAEAEAGAEAEPARVRASRSSRPTGCP